MDLVRRGCTPEVAKFLESFMSKPKNQVPLEGVGVHAGCVPLDLPVKFIFSTNLQYKLNIFIFIYVNNKFI